MAKDNDNGGHPFEVGPANAGDETVEALTYRSYRLAQIGAEIAPPGDDAAGALGALFEEIGQLALKAHLQAAEIEGAT